MSVECSSERLFYDIKSLVIKHKLFPVEGYEFPQETVAEFWKMVFDERGLKVFGMTEVPEDIKVIQTDFILPDDPPSWLICEDES